VFNSPVEYAIPFSPFRKKLIKPIAKTSALDDYDYRESQEQGGDGTVATSVDEGSRYNRSENEELCVSSFFINIPTEHFCALRAMIKRYSAV